MSGFSLLFGGDIIELDEQNNFDNGKISSELVKTLSDEGISELINNYIGIYFTGDKDIDDQIISVMKKAKSGDNNKFENLLFILEKTIKKGDSLFTTKYILEENKSNLESILKVALNKYSRKDLEIIYSFDNITFDVLNDLNCFVGEHWNEVNKILNLLKFDLGVRFSPMFMNAHNLHNINGNISYIKTRSDSLNLFKNYYLNRCLIANGRGSIIDLLLMPHDDFKLIISGLGNNENTISLSFLGYRVYKIICDLSHGKLVNKNFETLELEYYKSTDWILFWIDKGLPTDLIFSFGTKFINMTYDQCCYIYEQITNEPNSLIKLFEYDYDALLYLLSNVTKDINKILNILNAINPIKGDEIESICNDIDDKAFFFDLVLKVDGRLEEKFGKDTFKIIAFFYKNFKDDVIKQLKDDNLPKNNMIETLLLTLGNVENVEFFYDNGICNSIKDYITLAKDRAFFINIEDIKVYYGICRSINDFRTFFEMELNKVPSENIKFFHEKGICNSFEDFLKYRVLIACSDECSLKILTNLYEQKINYEQRLELFCDVSNISDTEENINKIIHKISSLSLSDAKKYVEIYRMFNKSSSFDIKIVKDYLIMDILNKEDSEDVIKKIDAIFLLSDLPLISKIFQVFKYVYNYDTLNKTFQNHISPSHYLSSLNTYNKKLDTIYKDLMKIMIKSGESSLKEFLQTIISNKSTLYDFENGKALNVDECNKMLGILKIIMSLNTIIKNDTTNNIEILEYQGDINHNTLKEYYETIKQSLYINHNNSIYDFFIKLCKKIGYNSLEDIILDMDDSQERAHINGLSLYNSHQIGQIFKSSTNYFLKGIHSESFREILNRGVTSSEYLGGGEGTEDKISSNGTPFDTDGVMISGENVFNVAKNHGYGNIDIILNTDKEGIYNTDNGLQGYSSNMYEIFKNHGGWSDYYGIRTGIASTEFDAIILKTGEIPLQEVQKIKYLISKNGHYLPVLDLEGNLIFTPEEYHILRQSFSFSDKYKGYDVDQINGVYNSSNQIDTINRGGERLNTFIQEQKNQIKGNVNIDDETMAKIVFEKIKTILESELGIKCNQDKNLLGAELYDSGSTGRGTEITGDDIDLDFMLLLNSEDYKKLDEIQKIIHERIGTTESTDHSAIDCEGLQIKSNVNRLGMEYGYEKGIRFELLILKKTKSYLYPSCVAMQDRLKKVETLYGKNTLDFVKENIVIMKKLLKSQGRYKNIDGGIGGMGVENRIMQHHGNFIEALESFENAAYGGKYEEGKMNIPFDEFKNIYFIWDSGQNFKDGKNDNFILKMNNDGYNCVLNIIKKYRTEGLDGLFELIDKYNTLN